MTIRAGGRACGNCLSTRLRNPENHQAAVSSSCSTMTPLSKLAPERTRATRWAPVIARTRFYADSTSLNTIVRAAAGLPAPRVTLVRNLTVENVDSMGFVARR